MFDSLRLRSDKKRSLNVPSMQGSTKADYLTKCFVRFYDLQRSTVTAHEYNLTRVKHLVLSSHIFQHLNLRVVSNSNAKVFRHEDASNRFALEDIQHILQQITDKEDYKRYD